MAATGYTPSRRNVLAAVATAPILACLPAAAAAPSLGWDRALAVYLAAKAAEERYDNDVAIPSWRAAEATGAPYDEAVTDESDRLCDVRCAAEMALMAIPAP